MGRLDGFGAALRSLRKGPEGGGTLTDLAQRTGVDASELSKFELERQWPSRGVLERILDGLGITLLDLAVEVERQQRIARGEAPGLPVPIPGSQEAFEARVREISSEVFASGLKRLVELPSDSLAAFIDAARASGVEPDLQSLAVLDAFLGRLGRGR